MLLIVANTDVLWLQVIEETGMLVLQLMLVDCLTMRGGSRPEKETPGEEEEKFLNIITDYEIPLTNNCYPCRVRPQDIGHSTVVETSDSFSNSLSYCQCIVVGGGGSVSDSLGEREVSSINSDILSILHPGDHSGGRASRHTGQSSILLLVGQR